MNIRVLPHERLCLQSILLFPRGAGQFSEAIENAVRMTASLTGDKRPNCLVIDEIDGAGAPAIQVLATTN